MRTPDHYTPLYVQKHIGTPPVLPNSVKGIINAAYILDSYALPTL